jgi:hypothetical protein
MVEVEIHNINKLENLGWKYQTKPLVITVKNHGPKALFPFTV